MINWITSILDKKLQKKKHEVTRLKWQKAMLEARVKQAKEQTNEY